MQMGMPDSDGRNALSLRHNPRTARAFRLQMKIRGQVTRGIRLRDMPEAWFEVPAGEDLDNILLAAIGVFACSRLMGTHRFAEADRLMAWMMECAGDMANLCRSLMLCDRICVELIGPCRRTA